MKKGFITSGPGHQIEKMQVAKTTLIKTAFQCKSDSSFLIDSQKGTLNKTKNQAKHKPKADSQL